MYVIVRNNELNLLPKALSLSCVEGVTIYWSWRSIEKVKDQPDFNGLIDAVKEAQAAGKKVNIAILPGLWSPNWLSAQGVKYMNWSHTDNYVDNVNGKPSSAPVPWDATYLANFTALIRKFLPALAPFKNINSVAVTGPSNTNGLEAAVISADEQLRAHNYSDKSFISAWLEMAKTFSQDLPDTTLTVALHEQIGSAKRPAVSRELSRELRELLGERYVPMLLGFEGKGWFNERNGYAGLIINRGQAQGALQAIKIYSKSNDVSGFRSMVQRSNSLRPRWLEIWAADALDKQYFQCQ
ncbi:hypothetical protein [Hydrocarboniphaga effusa]|uniref:hypothetical protein n=1 Tax=Hydrocarboniphaga effusa TaxID=243629 RepID=UPI0012F9795C|nr:hypothetical protein [Hydrocarboniphaga effusa]